jgi:hypothetical protein
MTQNFQRGEKGINDFVIVLIVYSAKMLRPETQQQRQ